MLEKKVNRLPLPNMNDINVFFGEEGNMVPKNRSKNDSNNKKRENIIEHIINKKVPPEYYSGPGPCYKWTSMKKCLDLYIDKLRQRNNIDNIDSIVCNPKGGRGNHYDFELIINKDKKCKIEFKYNSKCVKDTPQFVSPMKPSEYLDNNYEEYYYDNYLAKLCEEFNLKIPEKNEYLKNIHKPKPKCLEEHQLKYYSGCKESSKYSGDENDINFYKKSKEFSNKSISSFISNSGIKKEELTEYLLRTQKDKYYMLFSQGSVEKKKGVESLKDPCINLEIIDLNDYIIKEIRKDPKFNRYIGITRNGKELKILLRWKNGNGIAFPSFQIS